MSAYESYMRAFGRDLRQIAVWEPGSLVELGDYGYVHKQQWQRLGSIWDLLPKEFESLRESRTALLDHLNLGSAALVSGSAEAGYGGTPGNVSLAIRFNDKNSVFVRADKCETKSLKRLQDIADQLALLGKEKYESHWTFVIEVRSARRFLVLISEEAGGEIQVTAKTGDLLDAFNAGSITADSGVQISGSEVLQFLGRSGPIHMSLIKVSGPGWLNSRTKATRVEFAEGRRSNSERLYVENVDPQSFADTLFNP